MRIRKSLAWMLTVVMLLGLTGCQKTGDRATTGETQSTSEAVTMEQADEGKTETAADEGESETSSVRVATASAGDVEVDYMVFGTGEKVFVILPGLSVHSVMGLADSVAEAYKDFAEDYTVYLFERPTDLADGVTIRDLADDTAAAMEALDITGADVLGVSQGGMIAQYLAIDHPELVNRMVLGSTLSRPNDTFTGIVNEWIQLAEDKDEEGLLGAFVDDVYSAATLEAYRDVLISSNQGITDAEYERFIQLARSCLIFDCYEELSRIQCPVLVLGSEGDKVATAEGSEEIADALQCELYLYDDSYGHGVYDEAPDYKQRCLDFFKAGYTEDF